MYISKKKHIRDLKFSSGIGRGPEAEAVNGGAVLGGGGGGECILNLYLKIILRKGLNMSRESMIK